MKDIIAASLAHEMKQVLIRCIHTCGTTPARSPVQAPGQNTLTYLPGELLIDGKSLIHK